jgi:acetyl-CoA carboxylase carboxyltransferase component
MQSKRLKELIETTVRGGAQKYHDKNAERGKLFARERIAQLLDPGSFLEDGLLANVQAGDLPADGVITGLGMVGGRQVAVVASDSTVKAGSWGRRTVEKMLRLQETVERLLCPVIYLADSAGARITDQVEMFPGRRGAGRIFHNQVTLSGVVPQICLLFGPSAAGGAYMPAFCDVVVMVDKNASMYLGSPRMAEMVIGEKVTLEEMGGAKMHTRISGCGDLLVKTEHEAIAFAKRYLSYMPQNQSQSAPASAAVPPAPGLPPLEQIVVPDENKAFDMLQVIDHVVDEGSFLELKPKFAREILTGLCRIDGRVVGIVANQPKHLGGVLFVDSADKAARFVQLCDAYNIPLLFLADVPGFMIGSKVEKQGIIRAGAKMVAAVSAASVPKISVVVRKAYGAGLYAMCGPAFDPDACLALPTASIAVMGAKAAINAVFYNRLQAVPEGSARDQLVEELRAEYEQDIDLEKLASEMVVDQIIPFDALRSEMCQRFAQYAEKRRPAVCRKHMILPM